MRRLSFFRILGVSRQPMILSQLTLLQESLTSPIFARNRWKFADFLPAPLGIRRWKPGAAAGARFGALETPSSGNLRVWVFSVRHRELRGPSPIASRSVLESFAFRSRELRGPARGSFVLRGPP